MARRDRDMTDEELISVMRNEPATSGNYVEMEAELNRRVALGQLEASGAQVAASRAQIRSAWYQFTAVVVMLLTTLLIASFMWLHAGAGSR
jgi:hypothetical protein